MKKLIYLFVIGIGFIGFACGSKKPVEQAPDKIEVSLYEVKQEQAPEIVTFSGRFMTAHAVNLSTKLTGTVTYLRVDEGESIQEGQVLAKISNTELVAKKQKAMAGLTEAKANFTKVNKDYQRIEQLHNSGSATDKEWDDINYALTAAKTKVQSIENAIVELNELLSYASIQAPFNGYVTKKYMAEGDLATPGMPILTVESSGNLKVVAKIPESELSMIKKGDSVQVISETVGKRVTGVVAHINPSSLTGNLQFEATIMLPQQSLAGLKSGMYAEVKSSSSFQNKILIPEAAVFHRGQLTGVYTINSQQKTSIRWIRLGEVQQGSVEVLSGLRQGERIVLKSPSKLRGGLLVEVTK